MNIDRNIQHLRNIRIFVDSDTMNRPIVKKTQLNTKTRERELINLRIKIRNFHLLKSATGIFK